MVCIPGQAVEIPGSNNSCESLTIRRCLSVAGTDIVPLGALTPGSIPFAGPTGALTEDNPNLFWDDAGNRMRIGALASLDGRPLTVVASSVNAGIGLQSTNALGFCGIALYDELGVLRVAFGFANGTDNAFVDFAGATPAGLVIASNGAGTDKFTFFPTGAMQFHPSVAPVVSVAGAVSLAVIAGALQMSTNAGAYVPLQSAAAALTSTAVPFVNATGQLTDNVGALFWNNANEALNIITTHATDGPLFVRNNNGANTGPAAIGIVDVAGAFKTYVGFFPSAYAFAHLRSLNGIFAVTGEDIVFASQTANEHRFGVTNNSAFYQMDDGAGAAVSAAGTARIRYNAGLNIMQVSLNGGVYIPL